MSSEKQCAAASSKLIPDVYLRKELEAIARERGIPLSETKDLKKRKLCEKLGIPWITPAMARRMQAKPVVKAKPKAPKGGVLILDGRPCDVPRTKIHPNALTKNELVALAVKHLDYTRKDAKKVAKPFLCEELEKAGIKAPFGRAKPVAKPAPKPKPRPRAKPAPKPAPKPKAKPKVKPAPPRKTPPKPKTPTPPKPRTPSPKDCISRSNLKLNPHQELLVRYLQDHRGAIAAHSVGSGKTLTAVAVSQCFLDEHPEWDVIVVTPTSLQENFKKELRAYGADSDDPRYTFLTLTKFANTYARKQCSPKTLLIIDEAHNLKTDIKRAARDAAKRAKKKGKRPGKPRAQVAVECAKKVDKVLLLTATPLYNKPLDVVNLAAMVKGEDPLSKYRFEKMADEDPGGFARYFECVFSFYDKPKSADYPDVEEKDIRIIMTPEYYKKYRAVEQKNSRLFSVKDPWKFLTGVRQATNALDPCQKCEWAVDKIKEGKKTVLYSAFKTYGVKKIQSMLRGSGIKFVEVTGDMNISARQRAVDAFNGPGEPNVLFITKAGGEGLDLKNVRYVILLESGWNRPNEEQVIGRAARYKSHIDLPKSERNVTVYHLIIVKPVGAGRDADDPEEIGSADELLKQKVAEKVKANDAFGDRLRALSIERLEKCGAKLPSRKERCYTVKFGYEGSGEYRDFVFGVRSTVSDLGALKGHRKAKQREIIEEIEERLMEAEDNVTALDLEDSGELKICFRGEAPEKSRRPVQSSYGKIIADGIFPGVDKVNVQVKNDAVIIIVPQGTLGGETRSKTYRTIFNFNVKSERGCECKVNRKSIERVLGSDKAAKHGPMWLFRVHYFAPDANPKLIGVTVKNTVRSLTASEEAEIGELIMSTFCVGNDRTVIENTQTSVQVQEYPDAETRLRQYDLVVKCEESDARAEEFTTKIKINLDWGEGCETLTKKRVSDAAAVNLEDVVDNLDKTRVFWSSLSGARTGSRPTFSRVSYGYYSTWDDFYNALDRKETKATVEYVFITKGPLHHTQRNAALDKIFDRLFLRFKGQSVYRSLIGIDNPKGTREATYTYYARARCIYVPGSLQIATKGRTRGRGEELGSSSPSAVVDLRTSPEKRGVGKRMAGMAGKYQGLHLV